MPVATRAQIEAYEAAMREMRDQPLHLKPMRPLQSYFGDQVVQAPPAKPQPSTKEIEDADDALTS